MSKAQEITPVDLEKAIMAKVKANEVSMKPRWFFILGSVFITAGLVGLIIITVFLTNVTFFLLRTHGPMWQWRLQQMFYSFPLWVPLLAIIGTVLGIFILKKYDFSYKNNFLLIIAGFILSVILSAIVIDFLGLNDIWARKGPMRRFYQQLENQDSIFQRGWGQGRVQNMPRRGIE